MTQASATAKREKNAQGMSKKVILSVEPNAFGLALNTASIWPGCHQASDPYCQVPAGSIEELLPSVLLIASTSIPAILVLRLSSVMQFSCVLQCGSNFRALFVGLIVSASDASGPTTPLSTRGTCRASFGFGGVDVLAAHLGPTRSFSIFSLCLVRTLILVEAAHLGSADVDSLEMCTQCAMNDWCRWKRISLLSKLCCLSMPCGIVSSTHRPHTINMSKTVTSFWNGVRHSLQGEVEQNTGIFDWICKLQAAPWCGSRQWL